MAATMLVDDFMHDTNRAPASSGSIVGRSGRAWAVTAPHERPCNANANFVVNFVVNFVGVE